MSDKKPNLFFLNKKNLSKTLQNPVTKYSATIDQNFGYYTEEHFHEMLAIERKRTERSQSPIILAILDIYNLFDAVSPGELVKSISKLLEASTREIDIKGWYEKDRCIGIIYTEIHKIDRSPKESILNKIKANVHNAFGPQLAEKVAITCVAFPEEVNHAEADIGQIADARFYEPPWEDSVAKKVALVAKRSVDVIGSIFLILLFSPFFLIIPVFIKSTSAGPVFFKQQRVGRGGKRFTFLKFRSMYANNNSAVHQEYIKKLIAGGAENAGSSGAPVYKIKNDSRITPIGRFLRRSSLDEIPQFINVLLGNMSLVGPRPPIPYEIINYRLWHWRRVLEVKPGITGFWQVAGRSSTTFDTMVRMDLAYIEQWSFWWDIRLLARTPLVMVKGAY
ncbi:MAG: sugar transferase [Chitinivibrionales bacterium]|nr:sugar transferase [Chitinivibrionales bacterium]